MASRIFKGKLIVTGGIADENRTAFPEAFEEFNREGHVNPFAILREILEDIATAGGPSAVEVINDSIWASSRNGTWFRVDPDGSLEIGEPGV